MTTNTDLSPGFRYEALQAREAAVCREQAKAIHGSGREIRPGRH